MVSSRAVKAVEATLVVDVQKVYNLCKFKYFWCTYNAAPNLEDHLHKDLGEPF